MKSKVFTVLGAALALALVFASCDQVTKVEGDVGIKASKANTPGTVTAKTTNTGNYVILTWDAVDNASSYKVYRQEEGKKTVVPINSGVNVGYGYTYAVADGSTTANANIDKWSALISGVNGTNYAGKKIRFGVTSESLFFDGMSTQSDPSWTDYIQF